MSVGTRSRLHSFQRSAAAMLLVGLAACASPEQAPAPQPPAAAPVAAPALVARQPVDWSAAMQALYDRLDADLRPVGVVVTKTPTRQIQLLIPSDMSFALGRASIRPALSSVLEHVAEGLNSHAIAGVHVIGHTDSSGSDAGNQRLSLQRADSVRDRLVRLEVAASRITTEGMGSTTPVADNGTPEGRIQNRRIEIMLSE